MQKARLSIIAAIGENRELGKNNDLIWRIRDDLKRVKELTMGHPIIMGERTYQSIGRPLPGRTNIVLSQKRTEIEGCLVFSTLEAALQHAHSIDTEEIFIFGGASLYSATIDTVDRLYLTLIHDTDPEADVFFPPYTSFTETVTKEEGEQEGLTYDWITLERH